MSNSAYWNSQYNYYMTNKPPKPESYYNKSFVDRMNEAQKNIDGLVAEKDKSADILAAIKALDCFAAPGSGICFSTDVDNFTILGKK